MPSGEGGKGRRGGGEGGEGAEGTAGDGRWDAVVVGGGIAGLVAARELVRAGRRTLVLEASSRTGGSVAAHEVAGLRLDAGAESFATRGGTVAALADDLGLADRVVTPEALGSWAHLPSGDGPLPRAGLLGIPASPWAPDVRATVGLVGSLRAGADQWLPRSVGAGAASLGALVRARMGARVLDRLVRPVVGGVHAADPDTLAVDAVTPGLREALAEHGTLGRAVTARRALVPAGAAVQGLAGGVHLLVGALQDQIRAGGEIRTGARVTALDRADGGWSLAVAAGPEGGPAVVRCDRVVLATPGALPLLAAVEPGLAGAVSDPGAEVTLVTLVLDAPGLDAAPRGTGVLVAPGARDVTAKALTHATAKWAWLARDAGPGRHVLRLSFDTTRLPAGADDDRLAGLALHDASVLLGLPLRPDRVAGSRVVRWSQALPRPSEEQRRLVARVRAAAAALDGLAVTGAWVAGNGLASVVPDARAAAL